MARLAVNGITTLLVSLCGCRAADVALEPQSLAPLRAQVNQEVERLISAWHSRQADNLKNHSTEYPKTSPEEIQREVASGVEYVISRLKGNQPVFVLTSDIEYSQLHPTWNQSNKEKGKLTDPFNVEFRLPFETYEESMSSAKRGYQRLGRNIALRWFYSRNIYPVNKLP